MPDAPNMNLMEHHSSKIEIEDGAPMITLTVCAVGLAAMGVGVLVMAIPLIKDGDGMAKVAGVCWGVWAPLMFYASYMYMKKIEKNLDEKKR